MSGSLRVRRVHSVGELVADGIVHAIGIAASLIGIGALMAVALPRIDGPAAAGLGIYGVSLVAMFTASAAYNLIPAATWKPLLRRCDQAAIFLKIAGTYTPLVIVLSSLFANVVLAVVWVAALGGGIAKLVSAQRLEGFTTALYLGLGWASLLLVWPMFVALPVGCLLLLLAGGLLYTVGVAFHLWERLKFQNAIWHGFVLAAAGCHFGAVSWASLSTAI